MENKKSFSIKKSLKLGWEHTIDNIGFFVGVVLIIWVASFLPGIISEEISSDFPITALIITIIGVVLSFIIDMGLKKIGIDFAEKQKSEISHLFSQYPLFLPYLASSILYGLIILGGMILLIIPGIIWAVKYQFFQFLIIDKKLGPVEAIKRSGEITDGSKWDLFLFNITLIVINLLGAIPFGLGLIITVPVTMIALAHVYLKLLKEAK